MATDLLTYARQLRAAYCRETSELPRRWTPDNPSVGQCHVAAILLQDKFGGYILEARVGNWRGDTHYWNIIAGITIDATRDQFALLVPIGPARIADPPLQVTREKAALLARLAGLTEAAA